MTLNLPNLNSSGGSWVFRFAEMGENKTQGELNGPAAIQTTDPAYPTELMRKNVQGTVVLYAVIHDDGTVGQVRVLDGVNDRLDEYARAALLQWRFRPASKNGNNVTVEAVVRVPFKPFRFSCSENLGLNISSQFRLLVLTSLLRTLFSRRLLYAILWFPRTLSGVTAIKSRSKTTKSASLPATNVPLSFSANSA